MEKSIRNRTIALSALSQCVNGVIHLASKGTCDESLFESCVNSLLNEGAESAEALFGGLAQLEPGMTAIQYQLGNAKAKDPDERAKQLDATRYSINLLALERKLSRNPQVYKKLMDGITEAQRQLDFFPATHTNIIARLAELYSNTISTLGPRIMIQGDQNHLANTETAAKMRTLLLAGGSRWKLLMERGKIQGEAEILLARI